MGEGANVSARTGSRRVGAGLPPIDLRMVQDLLHGVRVVALDTVGARIDIAVLRVSEGCYVRAHDWPVSMHKGIAAEPSPIDINMSEGAESVVVIVTLGTPRRAELSEAPPVGSFVDISQVEVGGVVGSTSTATVKAGAPPPTRPCPSEECAPVLRRQV